MSTTSSHSFSDIANRLGPQIDAALDMFTQLGEGCPAPLRDAMRYSLLAPGKRFRPILTLLAAEACGGDIQSAMPAACAVEMVHTYSLIHDDLPAMDDDDLRRGRPTCHKAFDEATAILAGDALLTLAFEVLGKEIRQPEVAAACCVSLARAAGPCNMVGGQTDDVLAEGMAKNIPGVQLGAGENETTIAIPNRTPEELLANLKSIHRRKTGAMICVSLKLGALTAQAPPNHLAALDAFGQRIGLTFQITDDLLDVQSNETVMGKRVGKDAGLGKLTFPGLIGIEQSIQYARQLTMEAYRDLDQFGPRGNELRVLAGYVQERKR